MASSSNSRTPSAVGAPSLNSYLSPYPIPGTKLHTLVYVTILSNTTCNLPFYYASTCTLCLDPLQVRPTKCCRRRSRYGKTCSFYMCSYIIVRVIPTNTWCFVMGIDYYNNSSTSIQQQYIHDIVHRAFHLQHFGTTTAVFVVVVVVLTLIHRYNVVRGHRTGSNYYCSIHALFFNMHGIL